MTKRLIVLSSILIFVFITISCQQGVSPLASQAAGTGQQTETASADSTAHTGSNAATADFRKTSESKPGVHRNPEGKADRGTLSREQRIDLDTKNEAPLTARDHFIPSQGESGFNTAPSNQPAKINRGNEDEEPSDQFLVQIQPVKWNVTWKISQGLVTVRIKGEGNEEIDTDTLRLVGPEGAETNAPVRAHMGEFALVVKFLKSEAIAIIPDPKRGDSCEISVTGQYLVDHSELELLPVTVFIIGRKPEEPELSLVIRPKNWNLAWLKKDDADAGMITAQIKGEGFDDIILDSIVMQGPAEGTGITPVATELEDNCLIVKFLQNKAMGLILDPQPRTEYPIFVIGNLSGGGGGTFKLSDIISLKGKKKSKK